MNAEEHARRASELLAGLEARLAEVAELDEMARLQAAATGGVARLNRDLEFTLALAAAHALAAIAHGSIAP